MPYQLEDVRAGISRYGLDGYKPYSGKNSTWALEAHAVELYTLIWINRDALGVDQTASKQYLVEHIAQLLLLVVDRYRRDRILERSEATGLDLLNDADFHAAAARVGLTY